MTQSQRIKSPGFSSACSNMRKMQMKKRVKRQERHNLKDIMTFLLSPQGIADGNKLRAKSERIA